MTPLARLVERRLPALGGRARAPFVLGICGAQGSGKSTLASVLRDRFARRGLKAAILSLDDLYLSGERRCRLAAEVHPLLAVRGVPGTHDVARGLDILAHAGSDGPLALPRFGKASDEPVADGETIAGPLDVLIFEGWCVGVRPQSDAMLDGPVNDLERLRDGDGRWRRWVNDRLATDYARLFAPIDFLVFLRAPAFAVVDAWRIEQEHALSRAGGGGMSDAEVTAFVRYFQRLTEHAIADMPAYADLVVELDPDRHPVALRIRDVTNPLNHID